MRMAVRSPPRMMMSTTLCVYPNIQCPLHAIFICTNIYNYCHYLINEVFSLYELFLTFLTCELIWSLFSFISTLKKYGSSFLFTCVYWFMQATSTAYRTNNYANNDSAIKITHKLLAWNKQFHLLF